MNIVLAGSIYFALYEFITVTKQGMKYFLDVINLNDIILYACFWRFYHLRSLYPELTVNPTEIQKGKNLNDQGFNL